MWRLIIEESEIGPARNFGLADWPIAADAGEPEYTAVDGGLINVYNKTGEIIAEMGADEYGNGEVGAYNRKGMGRTLKPGP